MELIRKVLEFDIDLAKSVGKNALNKRNWAQAHSQIETQLNKINASVWEGMSKDDVSHAIAKVIYMLTVVACEADMENLVKEHLRTEHRQ